jgi:exosortase
MAVVWFPIVFLICAIPWPGLVYTKVAIPLQYVAAKVAVIVLNLAQVDSVVEGTRIVINRPGGGMRVLNVAEACAGMRSLMTFITLGAAIAFLSLSRPLWQKVIIVGSAVPIAIICNVLRVSGVGLLDVYVTQEASEGFAHTFVGLVLLAPALLMLLGVGWILDRLFIDVAETEPEAFAATQEQNKALP